MTRNITAAAWEQLRVQTRDKQFAVLLTITHPDLGDTIRVVHDVVPMVSRGNTFLGFPFDFMLSGDSDQPPRLSLSIQNVDHRITDAIKGSTISATMTLEVVLREHPDDVIRSIKYLKLISTTFQGGSVNGFLVIDNRGSEPCFGVTATKERAPALWFR